MELVRALVKPVAEPPNQLTAVTLANFSKRLVCFFNECPESRVSALEILKSVPHSRSCLVVAGALVASAQIFLDEISRFIVLLYKNQLLQSIGNLQLIPGALSHPFFQCVCTCLMLRFGDLPGTSVAQLHDALRGMNVKGILCFKCVKREPLNQILLRNDLAYEIKKYNYWPQPELMKTIAEDLIALSNVSGQNCLPSLTPSSLPACLPDCLPD